MAAAAAVTAALIGFGGAALGAIVSGDSADSVATKTFVREKRVELYAKLMEITNEYGVVVHINAPSFPLRPHSCQADYVQLYNDQYDTSSRVFKEAVEISEKVYLVGSMQIADDVQQLIYAMDEMKSATGHVRTEVNRYCRSGPDGPQGTGEPSTNEVYSENLREVEKRLVSQSRKFLYDARSDLGVPD